MSYEEIVESRIREAQEQGAFHGLRGEGRPLRLDNSEKIAGDRWAGFRLLSNAGFLPEWLQLAKEIEERTHDLARIDARHASLVDLARDTGDWRGLRSSLRSCRVLYEQRARELRACQDRFNIEAPRIQDERPAIWVEFHLRRLDGRVAAAGGPEDYYSA
jgi:hypothetical protein